MKVVEEATDRRAQVHIFAEGHANELEEWGEYVDDTDKAICCYVPIENGDKVRISGNFSGTTSVIAYDAIVDGVFRKASLYNPKTVHHQKNRKIDFDTFLHKVKKDTFDSTMFATSICGVTPTLGKEKETIGTIELRLYVTRQLDIAHTPNQVKRYDNIIDEEEEDEKQDTVYKMIPPTLRMTFDEGSSALDKPKLVREIRKINLKRPGTEPWAIFRFHYRSKEDILKNQLSLTHDAKNRAKTTTHILNLEPVPPLPTGMESRKEDGDSTRRALSQTPDMQTLLRKKKLKGPTETSSILSKKPLPKSTTIPPPIPKMMITTEKSPVKIPVSTPGSEVRCGIDEGARPRVLSKQSPAPPSTEKTFTSINKTGVNGSAKSIVSTSTVAGDIAKDMRAKDSARQGDGKKAVYQSKELSIGKEQLTRSDTVAVVIPKRTSALTTDDDATKTSSPHQIDSDPTNCTAYESIPSANMAARIESQTIIAPPGNSSVTAPAVTSPMPATQKRSAAFASIVPENTATANLINNSISENKRPKIASSQATPVATMIAPRTSSNTSSPRPVSIEHKVVEQRKKLEAMRQKRLETAKKQDEMDRKMEPYKKRMAEELARLERETREEEAAAAEDEEQLMISEEMLKEFVTTE